MANSDRINAVEFRPDPGLLKRIHEPVFEKLDLMADLGPRFLCALIESLSAGSASMTLSAPQTYEEDQSASISTYLLNLVHLLTGTNDSSGEITDRYELDADRKYLPNDLKDFITAARPQLAKATESVKIRSDKCCYHMISVRRHSTQYVIEIKRMDDADQSIDHLQLTLISKAAIQMRLNEKGEVVFSNLEGDAQIIRNCRSFLKQVGVRLGLSLTFFRLGDNSKPTKSALSS